MRLFVVILGLVIILASCENENTDNSNQLPENVSMGKVIDVLQTNNYTYLQLEDKETKTWVAVPKMKAEKGDIYYYENGMMMTNFVSKELNRTFEEIYFLDQVRTTPEFSKNVSENVIPHDMKPKTDKMEVNISQIEGGITIAELFSNRSKYEGKTVIIKGLVTKVNPEIMERNWIHLQDGTDFNGEFDLTVTSKAMTKKGDTIIVEGKIALNKDFGAGYAYDVIMEDALIK